MTRIFSPLSRRGAFTLVEILVGMVITAILAYGFYRFLGSQSSFLNREIVSRQQVQNTAQLSSLLEKLWREDVGRNPRLVPYSVSPVFAVPSCADPPGGRDAYRIGLNSAQASEIYFTADLDGDGEVDSQTVTAAGLIRREECFHYFLLHSNGSAAGASEFSALTKFAAATQPQDKLCDLASGSAFSDVYTWWRAAGAQPAVLVAGDIICLEMAFFYYDPATAAWVKLTSGEGLNPLKLREVSMVSLGLITLAGKPRPGYRNPLFAANSPYVNYPTATRQLRVAISNLPVADTSSATGWPADF